MQSIFVSIAWLLPDVLSDTVALTCTTATTVVGSLTCARSWNVLKAVLIKR